MHDMFARIVTSGSGAIICHLCSMWYMQVAFDTAARYEIPILIAGWTKGQSARLGVMSSCACKAGTREYASMSEATRRFLATLKQDAKYKDFPQSMEEVLQRARKRHKAIVLSPHWFLNTHPDEYVELIRRELGWEYPDLSYPARTPKTASARAVSPESSDASNPPSAPAPPDSSGAAGHCGPCASSAGRSGPRR